jgi:hypothetical protein
MANNNGTLVIDTIRPFSTSDNYPIVYSSEVKGGYQTRTNLTERDTIPAERREIGMLVYVISEQKTYRLVGVIDNSGWQELISNIAMDWGYIP